VRRLLLGVLIAVLALAAAGCGGDDDDGSTADTTATTTETGAASCDKDSLDLVTPGRLTVATDNPAFPPWFEGAKKDEPWDPTTTPTKKGYEAEVAYAVAGELGFTDAEVEWTVVAFNQLFRPGPKDFDFDINQVSYKPERAEAVGFTESYYDVEQTVVTVEGSKIADATSLADLKDAKLGAQIGTTSYEAITEVVEPSQEPSVYDSNNDAISALEAKQIDGIVVDFPTSLYVANVQIEGGTSVGRLPRGDEGEYLGLVTEKDSSLIPCLNQAIATLRENGTLDRLEQKWIVGAAPPLLQ
jgi:polar amino acid transport system substrate-binding protein